jgi:hypothetical protein
VEQLLRGVGAEGAATPEPGALPLLSHALLETWKRRRGTQMTLAGYHEAWRVQGAIATTADRVYRGLDGEKQAIARNIFLRLTELGEGTQDTRRRAALDELVPDESRRPEVEATLKILADARLVTTGEDAAEVAHEALKREWPALRGWLDENREGLRIHRHITDATREWERMECSVDELYRGQRLVNALEWMEVEKPVLSLMEREFLEASKKEEARKAHDELTQYQTELEQAKSWQKNSNGAHKPKVNVPFILLLG